MSWRGVALRVLTLVLLSVLAVPAWGQEEPVRLDPVVVTGTRLEQRVSEAPASVTVLTRPDIEQSPSQTVDDLLRQVPGFSLFRRSSSLTTHPTAQGVSLRGIGPSGASRALVLVDGIPVNDAFGGWVYWSRMPLLGIDQIEVVRGGGSSVWGNGALGGVIHVITARPTERAAVLEGAFGTHDTASGGLRLTEAQGPLRLGLEAHAFTTGGYPVVHVRRRGPIDVDAETDHWSVNGRVELVPRSDLSLFLTGNVFEEDRVNGTRLQVNDTRAGSLAAGGRLRTGAGEWNAHVYSQWQTFRSTFTRQADDRSFEVLTLDQTVPSSAIGGTVQWSHRAGAHTLLSGIDGRWVEGETRERVFSGLTGAFVGTRVAGAEQVLAGIYVQDVYRVTDRWEVTGGVRADYWRTYDGFRRDRAATGEVTQAVASPDRDHLLVSPRLATLVHLTDTTDLRASVYRGFRVPTINELSRVFRVRNDVTTANPQLRPERLTGGDLGIQRRWGPFEGRVTGFWNEVQDLVANVTLPAPLPDCPPGTTCRQRQNLDLARIRGLETELAYRPAREWRIVASHLFTDARVVEARAQRTLEGRRLAQVPENTAALSVRYLNPRLVNVTATVRYIGAQFEDDLNTLVLGDHWAVDVLLSRALASWADAFVAVENLLDRPPVVSRTTEGVVTIGAPLMARVGLRLRF